MSELFGGGGGGTTYTAGTGISITGVPATVINATTGFTAGTSAPNFNGVESGKVTQRATAGASLHYATVIVWNAGVRSALSDGNSATIPTSDGANPRIDVLLHDNTWISGTAAAEASLAWPAITAGKTWIAAVFHRANNEVVQTWDDATNSFMIGLNTIHAAEFFRETDQNTAPNTSSDTPVAANGLGLPILSPGGRAQIRMQGVFTNASSNSSYLSYLYIGGTSYGFASNENVYIRGVAANGGAYTQMAEGWVDQAAGNVFIEQRIRRITSGDCTATSPKMFVEFKK